MEKMPGNGDNLVTRIDRGSRVRVEHFLPVYSLQEVHSLQITDTESSRTASDSAGPARPGPLRHLFSRLAHGQHLNRAGVLGRELPETSSAADEIGHRAFCRGQPSD